MSIEREAVAAGLGETDLIDLRARYAEPHRHYHTWEHLEALHDAARQVNWHDRQAVTLAILFHDAIYQPLSRTNEDDSAELLVETMAGRVAEPTLTRAESLIRWTATHELPPAPPSDERLDAEHFLDIDMGILGVTRETYAHYAANVRKEFSRVPTLLYNRGRSRVLADFLNRDRLFLSKRFDALYDKRARENLRWELATCLGRAGRKAIKL